jgi:hypothetical protein
VWPYDRVGFGPGFGVHPEGHTLYQGLLNTLHSLETGWRDLFGWAGFSWILLPFEAWALRKNGPAWLAGNAAGGLVGSVFPCLVLVYLAYWVGADLFGPRYFYERLYSLTLFSGAGAAWLMGKEVKGTRLRLGAGLLVVLVLYNLVFYLPGRLQGMLGLNGIRQADLQPFREPGMQALAPALVIVTPQSWTGYGALLELEDPWLDTPFIFALTQGPAADAKLAQDYPTRRILPYFPAGKRADAFQIRSVSDTRFANRLGRISGAHLQEILKGSLGISVVNSRIWGCVRGVPRANPPKPGDLPR